MRRLLLPVFFCFSLSLIGQVDEERYFEMMEASGADEDAINSAMEQIANRNQKSLNLNTAGPEIMQQVLLITYEQAMELIEYREEWPPVLTVRELLLLESWDSATVFRITPYVITPFMPPDDSLTKDDLLKYADHKILLRFSAKAPGKVDDTVKGYDGNRQKILFKYSYNADDRLFAGIVAENDPGEPFSFEQGRSGFDYYAGYILYKGKKLIDNIIVGDYNLQFGQGLTFWSGFALSSGVEMTSGRRVPLDIRRHSGTEENNFLRGTAATFKHRKFKATVFGSAHKRDANEILFDSISATQYYTGFKTGGYHRDSTELQEKNNLCEYLAGANVLYTLGNIRLGVTSYYQKLDGIIEEKTSMSEWYKFYGDHNLCTGIDFVAAMKKVLFYGEGAISLNGGKALVFGADLFPDTRLNYSFHLRHVETEFQNLHSSIFRLSSGSNQRGVYQAVMLHIGHGFSLSANLDLMRRFSNKTGCHKPMTEMRASGRLRYEFNRNLHAYLQAGYKSGDDDAGTVNDITWTMEERESWNGRLHFTFDIMNNLRVQHRLAYSYADGGSGFLTYLDARIYNMRIPLTLSMRYTQFETDGYGTRIYSYESDVLYSFSVPAYYDSGKSLYLYFSWKPVRRITVYGRGSLFFNPVKERIINKKFDIQPGYSLQVRISL